LDKDKRRLNMRKVEKKQLTSWGTNGQIAGTHAIPWLGPVQIYDV
jgi:hypothetical protein